MKCDQIQEVLLTDYLDQELNGTRLKEVEAHLAACSACREFLNAVKASIEFPLQKSSRIELSKDVIWQNIKSQIQPEYSQRPSFLDHLLNGFRGWTTLARTLSVFTAMVIIVAAVVFIKPNSVQVANNTQEINEEKEVLLAYVEDELMFDDGDENGYNTMIEEYFL